MENYIGKNCPFCNAEITESDAVKICGACGVAHHETCWNNNQGCTTLDCPEHNHQAQPVAVEEPVQNIESQPEVVANVCANCGAPMSDAQAFCQSCGTPKAVAPQPVVCGNCGTAVAQGQTFCAKCGNNVAMAVESNVNAAINQFNANVNNAKKKNKALPIIIAIVIAFTAIFGIIGASVAKEQRIEAYIEDANSFYDKVLSSGVTMENIGNEIQTSWRAYVKSTYYNGKKYYSVDSAVAAALSHESSSVSTVENADSTIKSLYNKLLNVPDTSDPHLIEIRDAVKDAYQAYQDMYDCVLSPSGNYTSWTSEFGDVDDELADCVGELREALS